jgi:hypothetical protein
MAVLVDTCGNCDAALHEGKAMLYDERSEHHFCNEQCFREWASEKGAEKVLAFYRSLNISGVTY